MHILVWIIGGGVLMSAIALVGGLALFLRDSTLEKLVLPFMLPAAIERSGADLSVFVWLMLGFTVFFALEQFLHWHHCGRASADCRKPLTQLILIGDGLHNFIGGLAVAGTFLVDVRLGVTTWLAAAAHEIPQELGDFGVLLHGGWSKRKALMFNVLSALTFLVGGLVAYGASFTVDIGFLVPFAAGNFIYIGASDLVPEINKHRSLAHNAVHFAAFVTGLGLLWLTKVALG
ncbi:MAG: ZIP family metal transporter [Deltaproteobacteria bacterium]|nr:ZIP family metal transporter [Deltaproteobacteria bacterium]